MSHIPMRGWKAAAAMMALLGLVFAVSQVVLWVIQSVIFPFLTDALGLRWVPLTGGYFVIRPGSPLEPVAYWIDLFSFPITILLVLATLYLLAKFHERDATSGPVGGPYLGGAKRIFLDDGQAGVEDDDV